MYFEEKIMGGMLFYRTTPNGDWIGYSQAQLTAKLSHTRGIVAKLVDALQMAKHVVANDGTTAQMEEVFAALEAAGVKP